MAYEKTTWVDGETEIDAQKLNKMEEGIVEASQTGGILTGSIVAYDGDTIPEGYEEVDSPNVYSTEEKVVGEWLGKPLYRKVIQTTIPETDADGTLGNKYVTVSPNADNIINVRGFADISSSNNYRIFLPIWETSTGYKIYVRGEGNNALFLMNYVKVFSGMVATIIVEYTKTTD